MKKEQGGKALEQEAPGQTLFAIPHGIDLKIHKTIRIAVTGDVLLNKLETDVIDTPEFQRLRHIKELGTTYHVYPTALHTRFDHSLGTLSMAVEMIRAIRENKHNTGVERDISEEQEQLIRLYALLHDIGHVPFGHTIEDEFCIFPRHDEDEERIQHFLGADSRIGKIIRECLGTDMYERFMTIYTVDKDHAENLKGDLFVYDLVSNTVCADLLDYLRRDCWFCNVVLDMDYRFLKFLYIRSEGGTRRTAIRLWKEGKPSPRRDILSELIRLLDNRYLLGERVYFHHAKLISGTMLAAAVQRAKEGQEIRKSDLYEIGDDCLLMKLQKSKTQSVRDLIACLLNRRLWKEVYVRSRVTVEAEQSGLRDANVWDITMDRWWKNPLTRRQDEDALAAGLGVASGDIIFHCPSSKMAMKPAEMKVVWNGQLQALKDCTDDPVVGRKLEVILESHKNLWAIRVFLNPDQSSRRDAVFNACESLFTLEPEDKLRHQRLFYRQVVDEVVRLEGLNERLLHTDYEERAHGAVERLVAQTAVSRDRETIVKIVKNAFHAEKPRQ